MQPVAVTVPPPAGAPSAPGAAGGVPVGSRWSRSYFGADGRRRMAHIQVPVNQFGELAGKAWKCRQCDKPLWLPLNTKGVPVCEHHERRMTPLVLKRPPMLPYRELWDAIERPLRPVWALPGMAAVGLMVDAGDIPTLAVVGGVPLAGEVARRVSRWQKIRWNVGRGNLDADDPQHGKKLRAAIDRAAARVGYTAATATGWLAVAAGTGLDVDTTGGRIAWTLLPALWLGPAATWWRKLRTRPAPIAVSAPEPVGPGIDPEEARVRRIWATAVAMHAGDVIGHASDGLTPIKAQQSGKLAGTKLENWRRIRGGWAATIIGPPGMYEAESFLQAKGKIVSSYSVTKAMVSLVSDSEDENRCELFVQRAGVITEDVPWTGPDSVNAETGQAPMVRYLDGSYGMYEIYRPGWGCPHELYIGTTGAAKSSAMELVFTIDRWAHYINADGQPVGIVADFLIDPQQGQSFGAFADDLAAPVASTAEEALMLVRAFRREMLRRNKYLSRKRWVDERGLPRRGAKSWDPLVDGPILVLNIDEAHEFLAIREFAALVTAGSRMYRKCGMKVRIATHTPLLTDLGGSMALRDMLTGGFVWCGRTANSLSGPTAFNGRLPADPKTIPEVPGAAYILSALEKRPMLARTMWDKDFYRYIRDDTNRPIGYPGVLPPETLAAFGSEYTDWLRFRASEDQDDTGGLWTPDAESRQPVKAEQGDEYLQSVVLWALQNAAEPLDMAGLDAALRVADVNAPVLAIRQALTVLRSRGLAQLRDGRHELHPNVRAEYERQMSEEAAAQQAEQAEMAEAGA